MVIVVYKPPITASIQELNVLNPSTDYHQQDPALGIMKNPLRIPMQFFADRLEFLFPRFRFLCRGCLLCMSFSLVSFSSSSFFDCIFFIIFFFVYPPFPLSVLIFFSKHALSRAVIFVQPDSGTLKNCPNGALKSQKPSHARLGCLCLEP